MYLLGFRLNFYDVNINDGSHSPDSRTPLIVFAAVKFFINEVCIDWHIFGSRWSRLMVTLSKAWRHGQF